MAPPAPIHCYAPNCDYVTPAETSTIAQALQFMTLHVQAAHPAPVAAAPGPRPITKVEHWTRPEVNMDTSERDWRFFLAEWIEYMWSMTIFLSLTAGQWQFFEIGSWTNVIDHQSMTNVHKPDVHKLNCHWPVNDDFLKVHHSAGCRGKIVIDRSMTIS